MNRYVCIHAHFYQPPRENPWLEEVERQNSAYPYHDWNERVTTECYAPNTSARILGKDGLISDILNNYSRISFNFGPTLLSWMEKHEPEVYNAIIEADRLSRERFSGHGSALAQVYNHIIMPLANRRDKETQIIWGIEDFMHRFGRRPEGMWLAETAVDTETLELLAEHDINFTVLAPRQAKSFRKIENGETEKEDDPEPSDSPDEETEDKENKWIDVTGGKIDPKRPYRCNLPSGKSITLFFYDGPIAQDIAFGSLLRDGTQFAERMLSTYDDKSEKPQLAHIATDGETYGHHQQHGDMALAFCLNHIETGDQANLTVYAEYLEKYPPIHEVEIYENSSWSCVHGVERWRSDCGCNTGGHAGWNQAWRTPLRNALNWLRDNLVRVYEDNASKLFNDPWKARDEYIGVILDRSDATVADFLNRHAGRDLNPEETGRALKLLEMQRHALLMFTSCAWFFDEISGIETVQVIEYAARAMQLAKDVTGMDFENAFKKILAMAQSNIENLQNGSHIYEAFIAPAVLNLERVAAHYAVILLVEPDKEKGRLYCYGIDESDTRTVSSGRQSLAIGKLKVRSDITREEILVHFASLHFGEHNLLAGVFRLDEKSSTDDIETNLIDTFNMGDISQLISIMEKQYSQNRYTLRHLFRDDQRRILNRLVERSLVEIDFMFRRQFQHNSALIRIMNDLNMPIPTSLVTTIDYTCNTDLKNALRNDDPDPESVLEAIDQVEKYKSNLDKVALGYYAGRKITRMIVKVEQNLTDRELLEKCSLLITGVKKLELQLNLWKAQNIFFNIIRDRYPEIADRKPSQIAGFDKWKTSFKNIALQLQLGVNHESP